MRGFSSRGVDGAALRYRALAMPAGRASMQMTLASQGRSASALTGALSGSGTVTLESAASPGSIRAPSRSRSAPATADRRPTTRSCGRSSSRCCRPAPCRSRRRKFRSRSATAGCASARPRSMPTVRRAIVSGGYDIPADQADIRASLALTDGRLPASSRPEIQLFAAGSPDALNRTVDVAALSSWLAVRAIDRETRRLDSIERGEPPPAAAGVGVAAASVPARRRCRPMPAGPANRRRTCRCLAAIRAGRRAEGEGRSAAPPARRPSPMPGAGGPAPSAGRQPAGRAAAAGDRGQAGAGAGQAEAAAAAPSC